MQVIMVTLLKRLKVVLLSIQDGLVDMEIQLFKVMEMEFKHYILMLKR